MKIFRIIIKIFALCLAGVIIVGIFATVVGGVSWLGQLASGDMPSDSSVEMIWAGDNTDAAKITKLEIKVGATSTKLVQTDDLNFSIETNNKYISTRQIGNTLYIEEESHFVFSGWFDAGTTFIYVPKAVKLRDVKISAGAGSFEADKLTAEVLEFNLGAGKTKVGELIVTENARIEGGAGLMEIDGGKIQSLHLELGAGKASVKAELSGNSKVESGVGKLDLILMGGKDRYKFKVDKGIGSVTIGGVGQSDDAVYGKGNNLIELESGVGAVEVDFME